MKAHHGSKTPIGERDTYRTPPELFAFAQSRFGRFDYDTACNAGNALARPIWRGTGTEDALTVDWRGRCWCNPPYSNPAPWVEKAIQEAHVREVVTVMLIPSPNGEAYYRHLLDGAFELAVVGRIAFIGADGNPKKGNNRGSSFFLINKSGPLKGTRKYVMRESAYTLGARVIEKQKSEDLEVYS